jgi:ribosome-associated translation inhibitor RaiA
VEETAFDFEFHSEVPDPQDVLRSEARRRLSELAAERRDMVGASVTIEQLVKAETVYVYEASVVAYVRPENVAAVEKNDHVLSALKGALDAVERQVREIRDRRSEPWKGS